MQIVQNVLCNRLSLCVIYLDDYVANSYVSMFKHNLMNVNIEILAVI